MNEEKKAHLLEAAEKLFFEFGYKRTSISDITEKAGVAKGTFYIYYKSKTEIFLDIWKNALCSEKAVMIKNMEGEKTCSGKIRIFLAHVLDIGRKNSFVGKFFSRRQDFFHAMEGIENKNLVHEHEIVIRFLREMLEQGIKNGEFSVIDSDTVSRVFRGIMFLGIFMDKVEEFTFLKREVFIESLTELLISAIAKK